MKKLEFSRQLTGLIAVISIIVASGCLPPIIDGSPQPTASALIPQTTASPTPSWTPALEDSQSPVLPDFVAVVNKVKPSVVAINTISKSYDIFNRPITQEGAGSGWILDKNGLIATNNHVIEGATSISVKLSDDTVLEASVVGADAFSDLAVLKVNMNGLAQATVGDSANLQVGQWVLAIGNSLGEGLSATNGIISRLGASIQVDTGQTLYDLIQTSAAINPGNSGGPLVNMSGEVVGITSAKLAALGVEGMGYAIGTKAAIPIIQSLVQKGYVTRPYLGVTTRTVDQLMQMRYNLAIDHGAFLSQVVVGSPADKAGLKAGDVIISFNGKDIKTADDVIQAIRTSQIGQNVQITFWRSNASANTSATLIESPPP